jgi:hypothetical protein
MALTLRKGAYIPGVTQNFATSGTSAATTNAVGSGTTVVRISVTQDTYIAIGPTPTAGTQNMLIPGGGVEFIAVNAGIDKVAAVQVSTAGVVSVTELS